MKRAQVRLQPSSKKATSPAMSPAHSLRSQAFLAPSEITRVLSLVLQFSCLLQWFYHVCIVLYSLLISFKCFISFITYCYCSNGLSHTKDRKEIFTWWKYYFVVCRLRLFKIRWEIIKAKLSNLCLAWFMKTYLLPKQYFTLLGKKLLMKNAFSFYWYTYWSPLKSGFHLFLCKLESEAQSPILVLTLTFTLCVFKCMHAQ